MPDPFDIPEIPPAKSLRALIPDSPFLRLGNQLRLAFEWRRFTRDLKVTPDARNETDRKE